MSKFLLATLILLLAFGTSSTAQANLLVNPDFENGTVGSEPPGWRFIGTRGPTITSAFTSDVNPQSRTRNCRVIAPGLGWSGGMDQDVSVTPGQQYRLTGYAYVPNGTGIGNWSASIQLLFIRFIDGTGYVTGSRYFDMKALPRDQYNLADTGWITAPSDTEIARIYFGTFAIWDEQPVSPVDFDNFDFSPIPEPASLILLGSGLIGLVGFTRKRAIK